MQVKTQKSVQDFNGLAMSTTQQKVVKGGGDTPIFSDDTLDFIITDDLIDS